MSSAGCEGGEVGSEGAVELAGDEAFEAADGFFLGLAFCEAAVHVAAGLFAVAEPDGDDHVQGSVGCAVACEVEPVTAGAPARRGERRGGAQVNEGRLGAEPVDVLARGDELRCVLVNVRSWRFDYACPGDRPSLCRRGAFGVWPESPGRPVSPAHRAGTVAGVGVPA